jgi:hypothetical protein
MENHLEQLHAPPVRLSVWAWLAMALALAMAYVVLLDNGALLRSSAAFAHELFHDGRHFLGVPCH